MMAHYKRMVHTFARTLVDFFNHFKINNWLTTSPVNLLSRTRSFHRHGYTISHGGALLLRIMICAEPRLILKLFAIPELERALPGGERLPEEHLLDQEPLPEVLHDIMTLVMRLLCSLALGRLDLQDHWNSLQSDEAFTSERTIVNSILTITATIAGILTILSGGFKATGSINYFNYTSPMISGLSAISWLRAGRQWNPRTT
ncbi:hypothetical protein EDB19DRAFT_2027198 [Suillus lakei]|nr:hypothetical protein EDB19DRAFT_2027198 [Suillus lakei]